MELLPEVLGEEGDDVVAGGLDIVAGVTNQRVLLVVIGIDCAANVIAFLLSPLPLEIAISPHALSAAPLLPFPSSSSLPLFSQT
jgi:hypothetical protein